MFALRGLAAILLLPIAASAQEFSYKVREDRLVGGRDGRLVLKADGVEYRSADGEHGGKWAYRDVKTLELLSKTRIRVHTYEDTKLFGANRVLTLDLLEGEITDEVSEFLRARLPRPLVTAFAGEAGREIAALSVKHRHRFGGCEGTLRVYEGRLVYESEADGNSRSWLWTDLRTVGRPDPYRLELLTYEPELGQGRSFVFSVKEAVSDDVYDAIWRRVYRPRPLVKAETNEALAARKPRS